MLSSKELFEQIMQLPFGTSTWQLQCMALIHSARSENSNVGSPGYKYAIASTQIALTRDAP